MKQTELKAGDKVTWVGRVDEVFIVTTTTTHGPYPMAIIENYEGHRYAASFRDLEPYSPIIKLLESLDRLAFNEIVGKDGGQLLKQAVIDALKGLVQNG